MNSKRKLAAKILGTSPYKVKLAPEAMAEINKAITRSDVRGLIAVKKITKSNENEQSRVRARKTAVQKRKGRQKGKGSRKGSKFATVSRKEQWIARVRTQREFLRELRGRATISPKTFQQLYAKSKGGFFRNKRHIKLYITEHRLAEEKTKQ